MRIDEAVHALLGDEDKQELEIWNELLESRGFALLKDMLTEQSSSYEQVISNAGTWDVYNYSRGQRDALQLVLNLEALIEHKVSSIAEDMEAEAEDSLADEFDEISVNLEL